MTPTPRPAAILAALLIALISLTIFASAYPYIEEFGSDYNVTKTKTTISGMGTTKYRTLNYVKFYGLHEGKTLKVTSSTNLLDPTYIRRTNENIDSASVPVSFEYAGTSYGSGKLSYTVTRDADVPNYVYLTLEVDSLTYDAANSQKFYLNYDREAFNNLEVRLLSISDGEIVPPEIGADMWGGDYLITSHSTVMAYPWSQNVTVTEYSSTYDNVQLYRNGLSSKITVWTDTKTYANKVIGINNPIYRIPKTQRPYYVSVERLGIKYDLEFFGQPESTGSGEYSFALSDVNLNNPVSATLTGLDDNVGLIVYTWGDADYYNSGGESGDGEVALVKRIDGNWFKADENMEYTISVDDPTTYQFSGPAHVGQYKFAGLVKAPNGAILHYQDIFSTVGITDGYKFILPTSSKPGYGITAWLECSDTALAAADLVFYTLGDPEWYRTNHARGDGSWTGFKRIDGNWYEYNHATSEFSIPTDEGKVRGHTFPPFEHPDIYKFMGTVKTTRGDILYDQDTDIVVSGVDDRATLSVFVQRSDTGALIDGATVTVTGPGGEIASSPAPGGIATLSLPKTPSLQYWLSATAPGYTQTLPHLFGIMQDISITVEMAPETAPPANPDNVYLQFNVRDYNQHPVSGATVVVSGTARTTNAAGFARFEVAKNGSHQYTVSKTGYITVSGTATTTTQSPVNVQVLLYSGVLPTQPTSVPGDDPGATPPPRDTRTNEEKGKAVIDLLADNAELIATLAILAAVMGLINLIMPGRRRR
jgi:hypothetical protein